MGILNFLFGKKKEAAKPKSNGTPLPPSIEEPTIEWQTSKAHLLLLSRFLYGQNTNDAIRLDWEDVLGEPTQKALDRFISEGWLVPAPLSAKIAVTFKATEIKALLKEHKLPVSGRKDQGIERLVKAVPEEMSLKVAPLDIRECSPEARTIAEQFVAEREAEKEAAVAKSLEQLHLGDLRGASLTVAQFEAKQVFPRGLGIDWTKPNTSRDVQLLKTIFESRPKILTGLAEAEWNPLRVGGAMMYLWGTNKASKWLPADFIGTSKFDNDTAIRMVLFHAQHRANVESWRGHGLAIKKVDLLGSEDSCPACKKLAGKRFTIEKMPELPYEKCTHVMGCRCEALPVIR
ncbi:MAG: SAP domain-containing protein [Desulfobaccales bacterium]